MSDAKTWRQVHSTGCNQVRYEPRPDQVDTSSMDLASCLAERSIIIRSPALSLTQEHSCGSQHRRSSTSFHRRYIMGRCPHCGYSQLCTEERTKAEPTGSTTWCDNPFCKHSFVKLVSLNHSQGSSLLTSARTHSPRLAAGIPARDNVRRLHRTALPLCRQLQPGLPQSLCQPTGHTLRSNFRTLGKNESPSSWRLSPMTFS